MHIIHNLEIQDKQKKLSMHIYIFCTLNKWSVLYIIKHTSRYF